MQRRRYPLLGAGLEHREEIKNRALFDGQGDVLRLFLARVGIAVFFVAWLYDTGSPDQHPRGDVLVF